MSKFSFAPLPCFQEAVVAYVTIMQSLHPVDYGPVALLQTLVKFQLFFAHDLSGQEQRKLLTKFIDTVLQVQVLLPWQTFVPDSG